MMTMVVVATSQSPTSVNEDKWAAGLQDPGDLLKVSPPARRQGVVSNHGIDAVVGLH